MQDERQEGDAVTVAANGEHTLPGFSGSALISLNITVNNFADLVQMIRSNYSSMLGDVLEVQVG